MTDFFVNGYFKGLSAMTIKNINVMIPKITLNSQRTKF